MRINIYTGEGVLELNRTSKGGTVTDFIQLITDPTVAADAATKRYVDGLFENLNASAITVGTITPTTLPAASGSLVSNVGTNQFTLRPIVNAGAYTNVSVNEQGLVTGGSSLQASDIPNMPWTVFTTDLPTTPQGYGINDAISDQGGLINVNITLNGAPTLATHAATKAYTDTAASSAGGAGLVAGDIMLKLTLTTPSGFLRCNGALVSKTTYANLYAATIDTLNNRTVIGSGKPWLEQYNINNSNAIAFTSPTPGSALSATTSSGAVIVTKNKAFIFGGTNGVNINTIQSASIAEDGTVGVWANLTLTLPSGLRHFQVVTTKNYVYVIAGAGSGNSTNFIYRSVIDGSGNLGAWQTDGVLPAGLSGHQVFLTSGYMYVIGGSVDGGVTALNTVYKSPITNDGSLGTWSTGPTLPANIQYTRLSVTKGRVYLIGGHTGSVVIPNLIFGAIDTTGLITSWTASTVFPTSIAQGHVLTTTNNVYYLGGTVNNDLSGVSDSIYTATVNADGSIGTWSLMSGSCAVKSGHLISVRNNIYVFGGVNSAGTFLNTTLRYSTSNLGAPNDVSYYYTDVVFSPGSATDFKLPDISSTQFTTSAYYIKF